MAQWNLSCFASAILPLLAPEETVAKEVAITAINAFSPHFNVAWTTEFRTKLGLAEDHDEDFALAHDLLSVMAAQRVDFTRTFRWLCGLSQQSDAPLDGVFDDAAAFAGWVKAWRSRLQRETRSESQRQAAMRAANPAYIPRNHRVEAVIQSACRGNFEPFETLQAILSTPFDEQPENLDYQLPPLPEEVVHETFCGT